jgi:DNA-binding XRE family transcriptional regulator
MKVSGTKLMQARIDAGKTRTELAKIAMVSYTRIFQIETDEVSEVNDLAVVTMAKALKVKPEELGG